MPGAIEIRGLPELEASFKEMAAATRKEVRTGLRTAAEPIRVGAEALAVANIRNIGSRWSGMKLGSNRGMVVYMAPKARRRGGSPRSNLAPLLLNKAMVPALDAGTGEVEARMQLAVEAAAKTAGF